MPGLPGTRTDKSYLQTGTDGPTLGNTCTAFVLLMYKGLTVPKCKVLTAYDPAKLAAVGLRWLPSPLGVSEFVAYKLGFMASLSRPAVVNATPVHHDGHDC